jgi:hypothetical protein
MPDQPVYCVGYVGGSCGSFLTSLIATYLYTTTCSNVESSGRAHENLDPVLYNWRGGWIDGWTVGRSQFPPYQRVEPEVAGVPILLYEHDTPDFDLLFSRFPLAHYFVITCTREDQAQIMLNMYYKLICEECDKGNDFEWQTQKTRNLHWDRYAGPRDVSVEDWRVWCLNSLEWARLPEFYGEDFTVEAAYADRVHRIPMRKILKDSEWTLNIISEILGRETSEQSRDFILRYQQAQLDLVSSRAPWIT